MESTVTKSRKKPFLSICITSYNRVNELLRCLKSVDTSYSDLIEIVVSEDCSPQKKEIKSTVEHFIIESPYLVKFNSNACNLGYDCNLGKLIELADGDYVMFMSDDDAFCAGAIDKVITVLQECDCAVAFSPFIYNGTGAIDRKFAKTMLIPAGLESVKKFLFCSILFSGLIFKSNSINHYLPNNFKNILYFQVYLFAAVLYENVGCYINIPLVQCMNDGENAFGLSESSEHNLLLANRRSIYSNLEYHKRLIKVIEIFDSERKTNLMKSFTHEYSLRSYGGMSKAREEGKVELIKYYNEMRSLNIKLSLITKIYYWALMLLGNKFCNLLFQVPRNVLINVRKHILFRI